MTRSERLGLLLIGVVAGAFAAALAFGVADRLGRQPWFGNGANVIQWISGPGTFLAVVAAVTTYLNRRCAATPLCFRHGEHPVDGCLKKVCTHHHTLGDHRRVHAAHRDAHADSGRLDRGASHRDRVSPPGTPPR